MILYDFIFNSVEVTQTDDLSNVVKKVIWQLKGSEDEIAVFVPFSTEMDPPNNEQFINFEDLTEEIMISWVSEKIDVASIKLNILKEIELKKNPVLEKPLPWAAN